MTQEQEQQPQHLKQPPHPGEVPNPAGGSQVERQDRWGSHPQEIRRRPDPISELFGLNHLQSLFDIFPGANRHFQAARWGLESSERMEDGTQVVKFNLAGWKKEEVKVSLNTALNRLTITAERKNENESSYERRDFSSTIQVPPGTTEDKLKVRHEDGILSLYLTPPEVDKEHTHQIPVE